MSYTVDFSILAFAYLSVTVFFYRRQATVPSRRKTLFDALLLCGVLSIVLDIAAALIDPVARFWPAWSIYVVNIAFLLSMQVSAMLFFHYSISLTGTYLRMRGWAHAVIMLPFCAVTLLLFASPFIKGGIFYLDSLNIYHQGATHKLLYVTTGLYLLSSLIIVFIRRKRLTPEKFYVTLAFLGTTLTAMLIQLFNPHLLLNTAANAFALTLIYHILEAPSTHVDALTGVLNRFALPALLRDVYNQEQRCTLLVYCLKDMHIVNHSIGMKGGDAALREFAAYLKQAYPKRHVIRAEGGAFVVLLSGGKYVSLDELNGIYKKRRALFSVNSMEVNLEISLSAVNSEDCASDSDILTMLTAVLRLHRSDKLAPVLLADAEFRKGLSSDEDMEWALKRALAKGRVEVYFQPIHTPDGKLAALEALVRVRDPVFGMLPTQEMVEFAESNGSIFELGEQVIRKTCEFVRDNSVADWGLDHIGINLSALQCVRGGISERIKEITSEYGVDCETVSFEITETAAAAVSAVRETLDELTGSGFHFLLDDFGKGYASFRNLSALPYSCIKIDRSLLLEAEKSPARLALLAGIVKIIRALGLTSLCEGVETEAQRELLEKLGVELLQGYYYSKPLPPEELLEYAAKAGVTNGV